MGSPGREEEEGGGETAEIGGLEADPRVEVKNALDDAVPPTAACREEEGPGPGLGPELSGRQYSALLDLLELHRHCTVHFSEDLNLH